MDQNILGARVSYSAPALPFNLIKADICLPWLFFWAISQKFCSLKYLSISILNIDLGSTTLWDKKLLRFTALCKKTFLGNTVLNNRNPSQKTQNMLKTFSRKSCRHSEWKNVLHWCVLTQCPSPIFVFIFSPQINVTAYTLSTAKIISAAINKIKILIISFNFNK